MRFRAEAIAAIVVVAAAAFISGCQPAQSYVVLGDSFTSGPLITPQDRAVPGCLRSHANYPRSSHGPRSACVPRRQLQRRADQGHGPGSGRRSDPDNPPQLDSLNRATKVVTLGIGGNDIGFTDIAKKCGELGPAGSTGSPCRRFYNQSGTDEIAARIAAMAPKLRTCSTRSTPGHRAPRCSSSATPRSCRRRRRLRAVSADAPRREG